MKNNTDSRKEAAKAAKAAAKAAKAAAVDAYAATIFLDDIQVLASPLVEFGPPSPPVQNVIINLFLSH